MKKLWLLASLLLTGALFTNLFAAPQDHVKQYTLENGLSVFLLEDSSQALVKVEVAVRAGFSSQSQSNCGFFYLYTDLIQASAKLNFDSASCNADSSRYSLTVTPSKLEPTLQEFSQLIFSPDFSDELLTQEINRLKKDSEKNAQSLSGFLNSAIESRIYTTTPWKHDAGIYPSLFAKTTAKTARNQLQAINDRWYTPQNSAIFISGNFNSERILTALKNTFGRYYSAFSTPVESAGIAFNNQKKYVIHSSEFSSEMTQLVIEYTTLDIDQSDFLSAILNNNYSSFKNALLEKSELNIPGAEYIDASAVHTKNNSRMVIQTLLQKPEDKNLKTSSLLQTESFLETLSKAWENIKPEEVVFAIEAIKQNLKTMTATPFQMMDTLSSFWALEPYIQVTEEQLNLYPDSFTTSELMSQLNKYSDYDLAPALMAFQIEAPFVFAVISDDDFKKNKKAYINAGYEEITWKNASWYSMQMNKEIKDQFKPEEEKIYNIRKSDYLDNDFYQRNIDSLTYSELSNGIKIIKKQNQVSAGLSLLLSVKGGKINSAQDHGFEEVMINILGTMIQREIYSYKVRGIILGSPQLSTQTEIHTSYILIDFDPEDYEALCSAISRTLIYANLFPAAADRAVSSRQYKKRLENGSAINQMFEAALTAIYGKSDYTKIFDSKKDVLQDTDFTKIVNAWPDLLDAQRYSIILSGNIPASADETLEKHFGVLNATKVSLNNPITEEKFPKNKATYVKINHTFLTDIPAEKAGPQPAVLTPTTEFLDPVFYVIKAPETDSAEYPLFNALLNYIGSELQTQLSATVQTQDSTVLIQLPRAGINYGFIIVQNVKHTSQIDIAYKKIIEKLSSKMNGETAAQIKNTWLQNQLYETSTPAGTAKLIHKGLELNTSPAWYLEEYNQICEANAQSYATMMLWFPPVPDFRLYSKDSKN